MKKDIKLNLKVIIYYNLNKVKEDKICKLSNNKECLQLK